MPRRYLLAAALLLAASFSARAAEPPPVPKGPGQHLMIGMPDGVRLSAYLFLPPGKGPWPALYEQRYSDLSSPGVHASYAKIAANGYAVLAENFRGAHLSEGTWVGYRALAWGKHRDGYDTVEWMAKQPWCNCKVGTFGGSQAGYAQNFLAVTRPPHLVAQFMTDTGLSLFPEGYRIGGAWRPERFKTMDAECRDPRDNRALLAEWLRHPTYDDYWAQEDCTRHFDRMDLPCFTLGSWFDFMCQGSIQSYVGREHHGGPHSRGQQQLLIGPWVHGGVKGNKIQEMVFPENAVFDNNGYMIRWFDHYLKGVDNGVEREPRVRYYTMGATGESGAPGNEWRTASDWPIPATEASYYLHSGGSLSREKPRAAEEPTRFIADPVHPASIPSRAFPGAKDARDFEKQPEVRTFTSDVLREPVEWTGKVKAELYVTSDAPDTDFIVRLTDVYPDGRSMLLMDYVRRARYREGFTREVLMQPGKVYRVAFDVGSVSQVFNKGHRIRITVASTGAPFYEPNANTGKPQTLDMPPDARIAHNSVQHTPKYASRVIAPIPRQD